MDAGKKHKILKSEIKDFISHGTVGSMSFMFASISHDPQIPQDDTGEPTWMPTQESGCVIGEEHFA